MNIFHKKCKGSVMANIPVRFLANFGIGRNSLKMSLAYVEPPKEKTMKSQFFCPSCSEVINMNELSGYCSYCGDEFPVTNLFRTVDREQELISDIGCESCLAKLKLTSSEKFNLAKAMDNIDLKFRDDFRG